MTAKALQTPPARVLFTILCLPTALMAASNVPAEERLLPLMSPIPIATPKAAEAEASTFGSHPAVPAPVSHEIPLEQLVAAPGRRAGAAFRSPELQVPAGSSPLDSAEYPMKLLKSHGTANPESKLNPDDAAKPSVCGPDYPKLAETSSARVCRVYMYRDAAGTSYDRYTGWFVDRTHVVTAGIALANGGSGKYNVFSVNGRYGVVCCGNSLGDPIPGGGPENCPEMYTYNITRGVTTTGWLNKNQISNSGAVLKVNGLTQPPLQRYGQANPICLTDVNKVNSLFIGFPYRSGVTGCFFIADGTAYAFYPSYNDALNPPTNFNCSAALDSPYWTYLGGACEGTLGAPFIPADSPAFLGILTYISTSCNDGDNPSRVGFSAITDGGTAWGVAVSKMVAAIP
jgi:hypothetical protein